MYIKDGFLGPEVLVYQNIAIEEFRFTMGISFYF